MLRCSKLVAIRQWFPSVSYRTLKVRKNMPVAPTFQSVGGVIEVLEFTELAPPCILRIHNGNMLEHAAFMEDRNLFVSVFRSAVGAFDEMGRLQGLTIGFRPVIPGNPVRPVVFIKFLELPPPIVPDSEADAIVVPG